MSATTLTTRAFASYRKNWSPDQGMHPDALRYVGDTDQLTPADGLLDWIDGPSAALPTAPGPPPIIGLEPTGKHLWTVTAAAVSHAVEMCPFGAARGAGKLKHSNLTGGGRAYAGGEAVFLDPGTIVLNGCSGRYRMRGEAELKSLASAFRASGYSVWSMGYDQDTDRPALFGTRDPHWVAR